MITNVRYSPAAILLVAYMSGLHTTPAAPKKTPDQEINSVSAPGLLWREPANIASRDLIYGSGGPDHQPHPPFRFVKEDMNGTSPKFTVVDKDNVKWKVKLGQEARSETAASRLVWSAGYFTTEDYYLNELQVQGLPTLKRGQKLVGPDGTIQAVRLKREGKDDKKIGIWKWSDPGWDNIREFNGLRVLMAIINNWDLKDENNAVYQRGKERVFLVSDLGASFATPQRSFPRDKAKDNLEEFWRSGFIKNLAADTIDFENPGRPAFEYAVDPKEYLSRIHIESIGKKIPREHARWIGEVMSRLSPKQIRDAFRCAGYPPEEVEVYAPVIEKRIRELKEL